MLAVQTTSPGGRDSLEIAEVADPDPGPGEVLVRFEASSIHPADRKIRDGMTRPRSGDYPYTLGWDLVGTVEAGEGFAVGTRVLGMSAMASTGRGTWSERVVLAASSMTTAPDGADPALLAQLPLAGLTALQAVQDLGPTNADDDVLVIGAAGAVGTFVVQLLLSRGIRPVALVRDRGTAGQALRGLGVDTVDRVEPQSVDGVIDAAGIGTADALRPGGRLVVVVPGTGPASLPEGASQVTVRVSESGKRLDALCSLLTSGDLNLGPADRFALRDAASAFDAFEARRGRRVVLLDDELIHQPAR
jgi:NADPH:quinone reductase-like Zn-dependent oxidoreductase